MVQPANIITKEKSSSIQLVHYPTLVAGASDFDRTSNANAKGNFLNGTVNAGDQSSYDYVDLRKSLKGGCAKKIDFYIEASDVTELWVRVNPIYIYPDQGFRRASDISYIEEPFNKGWNKPDEIHRIVVTADSRVTYQIDGAISGFNIDYNGAASGANTPNIDVLIITCS